MELIDLVDAAAAVQARAARALICVCLTENTFVPWHADAVKFSDLVQASGIILAWIGQAFVDIHLTAGTRVSCGALALERS